MMASAAYWVGSQATDIVGSPSSRVGSIGVYIPHADYSKAYEKEGIKMEVISNKDGVHKGAGLEGTTLTSEQKEQIQAEVEEIFTLFKSAIQQTRNIDEETMQGQAFMGQSARDNNLIDAVGGFEDALRLLDYEIKNRQGVDKASLST
jgi:protease-4